jgi:D-alanine-D-alanine ligase
MTADNSSGKTPSNERAVKNRVATSIGPVEDLESYVKADWWRHIFNANYLRTDGDVVSDPEITAAEIDAFLTMLDASPDSRMLDLCCGQGRHVQELARRGFTKLFGVDRSHYLIARAKRTFKQQGLAATFREGDARKLRFPDDSFDIVYVAGNSFGYFESVDDDIAVLKEIRRLLVPKGQLLIDFTDGDYLRENFQERSWEWIDKSYFVCRERSLSKDRQRLISREVITHTSKGVVADQFYAERLYNAEELSKLLASAGFVPGEFRSMSTLSKRNQDLGMMAQRIVLAARSDKTEIKETRKKKRQRSVIVAMGDHRRTDTVKPGGKFDSDDFHTIKALKDALGELDEYDVTYLDDHEGMIDALQEASKSVDFILNLCDEGFNNEATKELHVPALLELLGIPYSGSDPQCLAYCYDKSLVRGIAVELDIPVPAAYTVMPEDTAFINLPLEFPLIVKPNFGDSSVGITAQSVCYDVNQLEQAIANVRHVVGYDEPVLVEQFLTGKDISVGIIGNPPESYQVLPVIEEDYSGLPAGLPKICGYEAKWDDQSVYFKEIKSIVADLPAETTGFLTASCLKLFQRLGCRDYARFDWRLDANGTPRLLEANPNPGWCWDGHLARMAEFGGITYSAMLQQILRACEDRLAADKSKVGRKSAGL